MLLSLRTGHGVPLLMFCAVMAGCATSTVDPPPNFNSTPQIVAIYAVDSTFGVLPDVLIFSTDPADSGKVSTNPPPSYGSYRVEFDQPIAGETISNQPDRATTIGGTASFCSPLGTTAPIQLKDLEGGGTRPVGTIQSSVCYDATSPLGSHPHVLVIPGAGAVTDATAKPLTCNTFVPEDGTSDPATGGNIFKPKHKYGIQVSPGASNRAGKPLSAPSLPGTGWVGDTFQFTTSGFKIMAAGYQDATTAFFVWQDKPEPGFEKDLLPVPSAQKPPDDSPFLIVVTEPISDQAQLDTITLRRADGSDPASGVATAGALGDLRVIEVNTGDRFEPGQTYTVSIPAGLTADSGDTLGAAKTYTVTTPAEAPKVIGPIPANGAQAQATSTKPVVEFSAPVAVTDAAGTPAGTFKLTTGANDTVVPLSKVNASPGSDFEKVTLTPATPLLPETTYKISWTGVKVGTQVKPPLAGQAFPDGSSEFTTATFRISRVSVAPSTTNIDRRTDVTPQAINNGKLTLVFNSTASGVDANSITLSEVDAATNKATKLTGYTVTPGSSATTYVISMPGTYQPKYRQKYEVRAAQSITDTVSGKKLRQEGCTPSAANNNDCSDAKSFTTRPVTLTLAADPSDDAPTGFTATFSDAMQVSTLTPLLPKAFKLFQRDASGALLPTPVPITCTVTTPAPKTVVTCTAGAAAIGKSPNSFLASAVFLQTPTADGGPAIVDPSVSTDPSAKFFGSTTLPILAPCP